MYKYLLSKRNLLKSNKGGIGTIVAVLVTTVLVLGLISSVILSQVDGAKDTGDKAEIEQQKISLMLQEPNVVTGNTVKSYIRQATEGSLMTVNVKNFTDGTLSETGDLYEAGDAYTSGVNDSALYSMSKSYDANGELVGVNFVQVDLSK